jgi:hypothetical protein
MASFAAPEHEKRCGAMTGFLTPPSPASGRRDFVAPSAHFHVNTYSALSLSTSLARSNNYRRIFSRFEKTARPSLSFLRLVATLVWLR